MYWIRTSPWVSAKVMVLVSQIAMTGGTDGLVPMHPAPCGGVLLRVWASWGDGGGVVVRSGCLGHLGGVPGLLRGDAPGQALVGALGVVERSKRSTCS